MLSTVLAAPATTRRFALRSPGTLGRPLRDRIERQTVIGLPRTLFAAILIAPPLAATGCTMLGGKLAGDKPPVQSEPELDDKWAFVGKEGRGHRPLEDEHDPLKPFVMSKEAQAIERSLGYK